MVSFRISKAPTTVLTAFCNILSLLSLPYHSQAATADEWRSRSIYQLITDRFGRTDNSTTAECAFGSQKYCGGTFQGIRNKLDYIQDMGFTAVWMSPVVENIEGNAALGDPYHGYWPKDLESINSHFGTREDLIALSNDLHARGMYLMMDVVLNNVAFVGNAADVDYSVYHPFNSASYYHPYCPITNYGNWTLAQLCWLSGSSLSLPDIDTEDATVISKYIAWGKDFVSNFTIDGFRVDAAKHVGKPFWAKFQAEIPIYMVGEVFDGSASAVCSYQSNTEALDGVLNYSLWYAIKAAFPNATYSMNELYYAYQLAYDECRDTTLLGTFTENQDVGRIGNLTTDVAQQSNALAFALMGDGLPVVYYGAEQGLTAGKDPWNREALWLTSYDTTNKRVKTITACNAARNAVAALAKYDYWTPFWTWKTKVVLNNDLVLGIRKGYDRSILTIVTNQGSTAGELGPYTIGDTNFVYKDTIVDLISCKTMEVGQYGVVNITVPAGGMPMVWIQTQYVWNTTLCPDLNLAKYKNFVSALAVVAGSDASKSSWSLLGIVTAGVAFFF